ncbi:hypothetical protein AAG570_001554 [Ranatra chinensis]|uniref:RING-CH-type domain-containing protein n=1 Tax=Ranatra chinensis TaxID=642074 RepID=A0ABD0Y8U0_9HEMI
MLISPCECAGTVALVHTTCIEKWLTSSNTNHCDLCKHKFNTQRVAPPFSQWMVSQLHPSASYGFFSDFLCLLVLTPACVISIYLCLREAASNSKATELSIWQYRGFTCLSIILLLSYLFWLYITLR